MNNNSNTNIRLANYIYSDLEPEEILELEKEISENPELAESVQLNIKVRDYLKARIQLEEMRSDPFLEEAERLADLAFEEDSSTSEPDKQATESGLFFRKRYRYIPAVAATIIILLVVRLFPGTNPDNLFSAYYEPLPATNYSQRGEMGVISPNLAEGINLYNQGNYVQSIQVLNQVGPDQGEVPEVELFLGLNYMGIEQYAMATGILDRYIGNNDRYLPEAIWYLSLCYVKTGEYERSGELLTRLQAYQGIYADHAQTLEKKLRRIK